MAHSTILSEEMAARVAETFKAEFGLGWKVADIVGVWQERLEDGGMTETNAKERYAVFATQWQESRKPTLNDLVRWLKLRTPWREPPPRRASERCYYCGDTGLMPVGFASRSQRMPTPGDMEPVYIDRLVVACYCSLGQMMERREGLGQRGREVREQFKRWYDLQDGRGVEQVFFKWQRRCIELYNATQQLQGEPPQKLIIPADVKEKPWTPREEQGYQQGTVIEGAPNAPF